MRGANVMCFPNFATARCHIISNSGYLTIPFFCLIICYSLDLYVTSSFFCTANTRIKVCFPNFATARRQIWETDMSYWDKKLKLTRKWCICRFNFIYWSINPCGTLAFVNSLSELLL
jgi:hypothetical protein